MFNKNKDEDMLDNEIERVMDAMREYAPPVGEKYEDLLENAERLHALKDKEKVRKPVSWDAVVAAGGSFLCVLAIIIYEQHHTFTSKGQAFIPKPH